MNNMISKKTSRRRVGRPLTPEVEQCRQGRYMTNIAPEDAKGFLELCKLLKMSHSALIRQFTIEGTIKKRRALGLNAKSSSVKTTDDDMK